VNGINGGIPVSQRIAKLTLLLAAVAGVCACEPRSNLDAPREFFSKHKIGSSPDWAIIKWGDPTDHVATVHGFADDHKSCQIFADALNVEACNETGGENCLNPFSCDALNY